MTEPRTERPKIVCLCGSTRFTEQMLIKQWELTKQGFIVVSWCALPEEYLNGSDRAHIGEQENVKMIVDEGHLRKIDLADEVFVINVDSYIGESTSREIAYAQSLGKPIKYLEEHTKTDEEETVKLPQAVGHGGEANDEPKPYKVPKQPV